MNGVLNSIVQHMRTYFKAPDRTYLCFFHFQSKQLQSDIFSGTVDLHEEKDIVNVLMQLLYNCLLSNAHMSLNEGIALNVTCLGIKHIAHVIQKKIAKKQKNAGHL